MKRLIVINQKGGCGKTATALSVGAGLARKGYKVLLIDLDPEGNLSTAAGITPDESELTIYEILKKEASAVDAIRHVNGYDIIPTDIRQSGADIELVDEPKRDFILDEALKGLKYDYVIIDSPPNLNIVTIMGLVAADEVIITLKADYLGLSGVARLKETISLVKQKLNPGLNIAGILITFYDGRKNLDKLIVTYAEKGFPGKVFNTKITQSVVLAEAPAAGQDIFQYRPGSKSAQQYEELVEEIIGRIK